MGFAASGGNATRQLAAVRGVGPRRVSSSRRRRRRDPRGLAPPRGTGVRRGAARPSAPRANQPDRPSLPMTRRQAALATMGLRVCHGRSQQRHALHRSAGRRVAPRAPRFRPPHSHRDRRCDADKSARGQPRHAATSPTARFISAHFHWRKSVPHPVTEYHPLFHEHASDRFHQRTNPILRPIWKMVIQHQTPAETTNASAASPCSPSTSGHTRCARPPHPQQRQNGDRKRAEQQQAVPAGPGAKHASTVRARNMHRRQTHPEAHATVHPSSDPLRRCP